MLTIAKILARVILDWILLGVRVRRIVTNDLPHAAAEREAIRRRLDEQIGFCRGVQSAGGCPSKPRVLP